MIDSISGESEPWLLGILNRVVRCSHRNHGRPFTPRGGGQSYAVCLDCGARFAYDLDAMRVETSVPGSNLDEEKIRDIPERGLTPAAPARRETMRNDSVWRRRDFGTGVVLCLGAVTLATALFYSPKRPAGTKHVTTEERARPTSPSDSVKSSPGLPVQESGTEMALAPQSAPVETPTVATEPAPIMQQGTTESEATSAPAAPPSNRVLRLEGKGAVVVLGRKAAVALELARHPERLRKLIRRGALFTVPRGTPIKLVQGDRSGNTVVVKVRLMAGSMAGHEGWAQRSQLSP